MKYLATFVLLGVTAAAPLQAMDLATCQQIEDSAARLKCFDDLARSPSPTSPTKPTAKKQAAPSAARWQIEKEKDQMTDRYSCMVYPTGKRYVQINPGEFYISYARRGGVQGFRYRFDDEPASTMQLPTDIERQIGAVHLTGNTFNRVLVARRLRVEILTYAGGIQNEDLDLAGLRQIYEKMAAECR